MFCGPQILCMFKVTKVVFFSSWRGVIFCLKNGKKESPTQGDVLDMETVRLNKIYIYC